jgi:hypothetical protein
VASHDHSAWSYQNDAYASQDDQTHADDATFDEDETHAWAHAHDVAVRDDDVHTCPVGHVAVHCRSDHRINRVTSTRVCCFLDEEADEETHVFWDELQKHDAVADTIGGLNTS